MSRSPDLTEEHTCQTQGKPLVTVAIPLYKRLNYLPSAVRSVAEQEYQEIELLISDNGENGPEVRDLVQECYNGRITFRRNDTTVPMSIHFNQLWQSAAGKYFVLLCDDDVIGPRFVSGLVEMLESDPEIGLAIPMVELMNEDGAALSAEEVADLPYGRPEIRQLPPQVFTGLEFVRLWVSGRYRFKTFVTTMARTSDVEAVGGYPDMPTGDDDAVALKLSLGRKVAFCEEATFRNRAYEESGGLAMSPWKLAADIRTWLKYLDADPVLTQYAEANPEEWPEVRDLMIEKAWRTYRHRWKTMYRGRMGRMEWLRAGFAMPFIPAYYRWLAVYLLRGALSKTKRLVRT